MTYHGGFTLPSKLLDQIVAEGFEFLPVKGRVKQNGGRRLYHREAYGAARNGTAQKLLHSQTYLAIMEL